jgi:carbamate kinase
VRVVVALGGNVLLQRGQPLSAENQRKNVRVACKSLAPIAREHELVVSHGNGPQVGLLALQGSAYTTVETYPLDVLGAQTEGMIGYIFQQELGNELPADVPLVTVLTMIEVDGKDPTFDDPTKPIGPVYTAADADALRRAKGWRFKLDGDTYRRVVPSPLPRRIIGVPMLEILLEAGCVVICAGGGGIPTVYAADELPAGRRLVGVEAVIDKDFASALLAVDLRADVLLIATDVEAVFADWGTPRQRAIRRATPRALAVSEFADGSMGPKVRAACSFVEQTGGVAAIGSIADVEGLLRKETGTVVSLDARGLEVVGAA